MKIFSRSRSISIVRMEALKISPEAKSSPSIRYPFQGFPVTLSIFPSKPAEARPLMIAFVIMPVAISLSFIKNARPREMIRRKSSKYLKTLERGSFFFPGRCFLVSVILSLSRSSENLFKVIQSSPYYTLIFPVFFSMAVESKIEPCEFYPPAVIIAMNLLFHSRSRERCFHESAVQYMAPVIYIFLYLSPVNPVDPEV